MNISSRVTVAIAATALLIGGGAGYGAALIFAQPVVTPATIPAAGVPSASPSVEAATAPAPKGALAAAPASVTSDLDQIDTALSQLDAQLAAVEASLASPESQVK